MLIVQVPLVVNVFDIVVQYNSDFEQSSLYGEISVAELIDHPTRGLLA